MREKTWYLKEGRTDSSKERKKERDAEKEVD